MAPRPLTMSANYLTVVRGLRELHRLTAVGHQDSPEADAARDASDAPWGALTEGEKRRLSGLSEDLYSITDPPRPFAGDCDPRVQSRLVEMQQARHRGEWDRSLELLRRWATSIEPSVLSYLRGFTWLGAGDPETAALFFEHASQLQPENGAYLAMLLDAMKRFDLAQAQRRAHEILEASDRYEPIVIGFAADVVLGSVPGLPPAQISQVLRRLIPRLEFALSRIESGDSGELDLSVFTKICRLLGFCHESLGESQAALRCYSRGIAADPTNELLLVYRGILLYGESPRAVEDFKLAIERESSVIWPYYYLAHHALLSGLLELCRSVSERALEKEGPDPIKSELAEWLAIAQSELGYPAETVRESFDRSIRFDPTNERARRNLATFDASAQPIPASAYETRDKAAIRVSGLSERQSRPAA